MASIKYIRDQKSASCLSFAYIFGGRDRATIDFAKKTDCVGLPPPAMIENMSPTSIHQASGLLKAPTSFIKVQSEYRWSMRQGGQHANFKYLDTKCSSDKMTKR